MYLLTVVISVAFIIPVTNGQKLNCIECDPSQPCYNNKTVLCDDSTLTCYAAQLLVGGETTYKKGCIERDVCATTKHLCPGPGRDPQSGPKPECVGGGCCNSSGCVASITVIPKPSPTVVSSSSVAPEKAVTSKIMPTPEKAATSKIMSTPKMEAGTSTQTPVMKTSMKDMMSPVSPLAANMSKSQVYSQVLTKEVLGTPTPACSSIRYLSSPLAILIAAIAIMYVVMY